MPRIHMHLVVEDLAAAIRFYSVLLGSGPTVQKPDYAEWELDNPPVNFDVSTRGSVPGLDHVGIQFETEAELAALQERLEQGGYSGVAQQQVTCCYERSNKYWILDPAFVSWELFQTLQPIERFSEDEYRSLCGCRAPFPGGELR